MFQLPVDTFQLCALIQQGPRSGT